MSKHDVRSVERALRRARYLDQLRVDPFGERFLLDILPLICKELNKLDNLIRQSYRKVATWAEAFTSTKLKSFFNHSTLALDFLVIIKK